MSKTSPHIEKHLTVIGLDEVGRGCLAGPVVSAAVIEKRNSNSQGNPCEFFFEPLDPQAQVYFDFFKIWKTQPNPDPRPSSPLAPPKIQDSKSLSPIARRKAYYWILDHYEVCLGLATPTEIDHINILQASLLSMKRAALGLTRKWPEQTFILHIDGNQKIPQWEGAQLTIIQGDSQSQTIAAASIVAKVFRDDLMTYLDSFYPEYQFLKHKGYPSPSHKQKIIEIGPSPEHRLSFRGVAEV